MAYRIEIRPAAKKALESLEKRDYLRIRKAVDNLADNPRPRGCVKLAEIDAMRIRVGSFRVIYTIVDEKLLVVVLRIGNRKNIYRFF